MSPRDVRPSAAPGPHARADASQQAHALHTAWLYFAVACGSMIGGTARWLSSVALHGWLGAGFPWGTLAVNIAGSFLIGFYAAAAGPDGRLFPGPLQRQFVMAGFCGGFTTFSIFSLETLHLARADRLDLAALYVSVSVTGWLLAVWAGHAVATRINRLRR